MKVLLRLICFIALLMSSLEADNCMERESIIHVVSSADEIDVRTCPLNPNEDKGTISWYKNDSKIPLPMDPVSRIRQREDNLWFIPAKVEDSGYYYCVVRNASHCLRIKVTVEFVENDPDLCFNTQARFAQRLPVAGDGKIVCPYLDYFRDENNELPKIQWYKDCKPFPLDETCFSGVADKLIVSNVAEEHRGNYTCRTSYTYLGKQYHVSRVIELITVEDNRPLRPKIVSPANETMEVVLGSQIQLICNVTGEESDNVYWKWNGSVISEDDTVLVEDYDFVENTLNKRRSIVITMLNISEVESRFYLYPFTCIAKNTKGNDEAYVQLIHPVPDFQNHVIGAFVMLTVIIICSVFIYKIFKVDIVLWYRDSCYDFLPPKGIILCVFCAILSCWRGAIIRRSR